MSRIPEKDLKIPALEMIKQNPGITTSELIDNLVELMKPQGEDIEILAGRKDTKFSQKVRNLKSHETLSEYAIYNDGTWMIKPEGITFLEKHRDLVDSLMNVISGRYDSSSLHNVLRIAEESTVEGGRGIYLYDERMLIEEGKEYIVSSIHRTRSRRLRSEAINHFRVDGRIFCHICGFDFERTYGELGKDYIEIHHKIPIYQYDDQDFKQFIGDAIENLIPVCSNCHRMLHSGQNVQVKDIKELLSK